MKVRAVVEFALPDDEEGMPPYMEGVKREVEGQLPTTAILKSVEHVPETNELRAAFKRLLRFKLESIPVGLTRREGYTKGDEKAPFFSEALLYPLLGKDDARSVLGLVRNLMRALQMDPYEIEREVRAEIAAEEAEEASRQLLISRRREFRIAYCRERGWPEEMLKLSAEQRAEIVEARKKAGIQ